VEGPAEGVWSAWIGLGDVGLLSMVMMTTEEPRLKTPFRDFVRERYCVSWKLTRDTSEALTEG